MKKLYGQFAVVVAVSALASGCGTFHHEEKNVQWDTVPAVVQGTVQAHLYGGTVDTIEREQNDHCVVYEVKVNGSQGWHSEIKVGEDGKLLKYKTCKE